MAAMVLLAAPAAAAPPTDPACLPLIGGSTGLLYVGGSIPTGDTVVGRQGGYGPVATGEVVRTLPDDVVFKSRRETFSNVHAFALRDGRLYVRPAVRGRANRAEPWRVLELPACLDGKVTGVSADHRLLLVTTSDRQLYAHDMPGDDISPERWTWRWGPYFWTGTGVAMFDDVEQWSTSEFTSQETFRDSSGREQHPIGVATVYLLRKGGRRITYLDPWLPADESREVCGPRRGTVPLVGMDASGSTVFAVSRRAELFTRLYDFDVSGANTVFGRFSWARDRPGSDTRWQLPGPEWVRQPIPRNGVITDRVTIGKTGAQAGDRMLRVEGRTRKGRVGYWEKPIDDRRAAAWRFVPTGGTLVGTPLSRKTRTAALAPEHALRYAGSVDGTPAQVTDLHPECSPATLRVTLEGGTTLDLLLHTSDGLRQETRANGLDDTPREYNGAIEVPRDTWKSLDGPARRFVDRALGGKRILTAPIALTSTKLVFIDRCWTLTLNGDEARPDVPRVPPDAGAALARSLEREQDGRDGRACP